MEWNGRTRINAGNDVVRDMEMRAYPEPSSTPLFNNNEKVTMTTSKEDRHSNGDSDFGDEEKQETDDKLKTTNLETLMHILKGNIGTGILALPFGFKNAGLTLGTLGLVLICVLCTHCMHLILISSRTLGKRLGMSWIDYPEVSKLAFKSGPPSLQKFGKSIGTLTNTFMVFAQLGFCCVYIIFVSSNCQMVLNYYKLGGSDVSLHTYMAIFLPFFVLVNYVRSLKYLAIFSTLANVCQIGSLVILFYHLFRDIPSPASRPQVVTDLTSLPLWFGTVLFASTGIGLVLPLEKKMRSRNSLGGWFGVLNLGMLLVSLAYTSLGFFGYLKYGDKSEGSVTLNLPEDEISAQVCKLMYGLAIFFTYPLQFYVPIQLMWPPVEKRLTNFTHIWIMEYVFRTVIVLVTFTLAFLIPKLGLFISLVGAFSCSYLALIMPPIIHTIVLKTDGQLTSLICIKNVLISVFGILGTITGTYVSIKDIVEAFKNDP